MLDLNNGKKEKQFCLIYRKKENIVVNIIKVRKFLGIFFVCLQDKDKKNTQNITKQNIHTKLTTQ